jgi:hypothetical protein
VTSPHEHPHAGLSILRHDDPGALAAQHLSPDGYRRPPKAG